MLREAAGSGSSASCTRRRQETPHLAPRTDSLRYAPETSDRTQTSRLPPRASMPAARPDTPGKPRRAQSITHDCSRLTCWEKTDSALCRSSSDAAGQARPDKPRLEESAQRPWRRKIGTPHRNRPQQRSLGPPKPQHKTALELSTLRRCPNGDLSEPGLRTKVPLSRDGQSEHR